MAKKKNKNEKRRLMVMGPICAIIIGTFIFNAASYFHRIMVLEKSKADLEQQLVVLKEKEETLTSDIQKLKDPEYIAKYARENYMYSMDGEYIIKIEDDEKIETKEKETFNYWYLVLGSSLVLLIILLHIFKKRKQN